MKKMNEKQQKPGLTKKLVLNKETLRNLKEEELQHVAGGQPALTRNTCDSGECTFYGGTCN